MSYITAIETAVPEHRFSQETFTEFYLRSADEATDKRRISIVSRRSGISERYSVIPDFGAQPEAFEFFAKTSSLLPEPGLGQRMTLYRKHALDLSRQAVRKIKEFEKIKHSISHLITVTCTGLFAPGNDIDLIHELQLNPGIRRFSVNFMGCNAAIIALKQADAICKAEPLANVLIVCTELCSIHFQRRYSDDYILSNLIFGDGSAALLMSAKPANNYPRPVEVSRFDSLIATAGYKDMAWQLSETGFIMDLSSYVSDIIRENMKPFFDGIAADRDGFAHWAIHPGGKRILDDVASALELRSDQLGDSYEVLKRFGNMSSPTVLFVLKRILDRQKAGSVGEKVFAAAFGPGLSIETMQLSYV